MPYLIEETAIAKNGKEYKTYLRGSMTFCGMKAPITGMSKEDAKVFYYRNEAVRQRDKLMPKAKVIKA